LAQAKLLSRPLRRAMDFDELEEQEEVSRPVLVCFYSAGMTAKQGLAQMKPFLDAARKAGLTDQVVLDHPSEPPYAGCNDWDSFTSKLVEQLDAEPTFKDREVVIVAHSLGALAAYGLALRLEPRRAVRKLCVIARNPPATTFLSTVFGVETRAAIAELDDAKLLNSLVGAWSGNLFFEGHKHREASKIPAMVKSALGVVRHHFSTPCYPIGDAELIQTFGAKSPVSAPILAVAARQELPKGETAAKVEGWRDFTTGGFELKTVNTTHMGVMQDTTCHELVLEALRLH